MSLNVDDVAASSAFLTKHFGFHAEMAADGFASLTRDDTRMMSSSCAADSRRFLPTSATTTRAG